MNTCSTLLRTSLSSFKCSLCSTQPTLTVLPPAFFLTSGLRVASRCYASAQEAASIEPIHINDQPLSPNPIIEPPEDQPNDTVEHLLTHADDVARLMKMERKTVHDDASRWFPYIDRFKCHNTFVTSGEILEAVGPCISDVRKERFRNVVRNRSYSVCLVVEGLSDFGNVSAAFRSADALGFQSVHVVSCDSSKRCTDN
ncbi:uncharacterized protein LOC129296986 [Prosopis cineraria]|uniref:uncharacterized protein LOC129296986 n=1 Tax=Prosopis cineraria TaxID=364024 RepID=UPI00240EE832|nr:uncharacterized protein LOC129296986 [Prosopis cineraria]